MAKKPAPKKKKKKKKPAPKRKPAIRRWDIDEFEVGDGGALRPAGFADPETREDIYNVSLTGLRTPADLVYEMDNCQALECEMVSFYESEGDDLEPPPSTRRRRTARPLTVEEQTRAWLLKVNRGFFEKILVPHVTQWLRAPWELGEEDDAQLRSGQEAALKYFLNMEHASLEVLGVKTIEGEFPGSSYFAAELRRPLAEANRAAEAAGLPVRFVKESPPPPPIPTRTRTVKTVPRRHPSARSRGKARRR